MKLISKATLLYLLLFMAAIAASGFLISHQSQNLFDRQMERHFHRWEHGTLYRIQKQYKMDEINSLYRQVQDMGTIPCDTLREFFRDTLMAENVDDVPQLFRSKTIVRKVNDRYYRMTFYKNIDEYRDLQRGIFETLVWVFVGLVLVLLLFNFFISGWLWRPFYHTLERMRNFSLGRKEEQRLERTSTKEFRELNELYSQMVEKIEDDYQNLKEFTENTAHEIQTPLAIIKAKIENILRKENLEEDLLLPLSAINDSASKLSRLSRTLNLLTKIENQEFISREEIRTADFIGQTLYNFQELANLKEITMETDLDEGQTVLLDPFLLDILVGNLLKNAIRYNFRKGRILIKTMENRMIFANTGDPPAFAPERIFERFSRNGNNSNSLGLGLAIVKKICDLNGFSIEYDYSDGMHRFEVSI